ncbi:SIS domain-containing protein [Kitasatospora fiedleri]|uniref:SIS domain-containing protein n=1 Tax=Kitasatospora fiedleri TaxID=2991545 RepID=UPI00249ABACF|nr:SIS domain-containing protein [Kitasatospora fiedleri]
MTDVAAVTAVAATAVAAEIASQPECWRRAMAVETTALPAPGERVAVVGCGTSLYVAQAYAVLRETAGAGETDAFAASEYPADRRYDRVLAITRSGTTTEVLAALARARAAGLPTTAVTGDPATPVATAADALVDLSFADERSVVQTRFATTALVLLRTGLGLTPADLPEQAAAAIAAELPEDALAAGQFTFLGAGWTVGLANEAALKLREAAGAWTESYPAMEYRHGPISVSGPDSLVWFLGDPPAGLPDRIAATGARVASGRRDPLAELVRAQRLAVALAEARGHDPDHPRNLTRSIVLDTP